MDARSKVQQQPPKIPNEKSGTSNFPSVPAQDLHVFALKIRIKDNAWIFDHVPANPRFLVSSTDYPTIIQAGFHYNALHMAARWGNVQVVQLVLSSISSTEFVKSLYPDDDFRSITKRVKFLTDMYLNTPETGALETPLHFACKFNWYEVVKLLIGHPSIDLKAKNDLNQTAEEIIGTRREDDELTHKIKHLFRNDLILPIWRDQFDVAQPIVGPVVNPKYLGELTPAPFVKPYGKISMDLYGPVDKSAFPKSGFNNQWKIVGYIGPTDEVTVHQLYSALRRKDLGGGNNSFNRTPPLFDTPPANGENEAPRTPKLRKRVSLNLMVTSTPTRPGTSIAPLNQSIQELNESFETLGIQSQLQQRPRRQSTPTRLSMSMGQYTPPRIGQVTPTRLGQVTPTRFGTTQRNTSINASVHEDESPFAAFLEETIIRRTDPEKGIERIARRYAKELDVPWVEHWTFLNKFVDLRSDQGLAELEAYFLLKEQTIEPIEKAKFLTPISQICVGLDKIAINSPPGAAMNVTPTCGSLGGGRHHRQRECGRPRSTDREDWRLHSFVQFRPDSDDDDHEKQFTRAVAANGLLMNGCKGDGRESGLQVRRLFTDKDTSSSSSGGESDQGNGKGGTNSRLKSRARGEVKRVGSAVKKVTIVPPEEMDLNTKPLQLFKYRDKSQLVDSDSNSDEDDNDDDDGNRGPEQTATSAASGDENRLPGLEGSEDEHWYSPPVTPPHSQSPPNESYDECFSYAAYVKGQNPSKYDDQLICAIALVEPELLDKYPAVSRWYNLMKSLGSDPRSQSAPANRTRQPI